MLAEQVPPLERAMIEQAVEREVAEAFVFAASSPFPAVAELMTDIYTEDSHELLARR